MVQESFSQSDVMHGISCCAMAMTLELLVPPMEVHSLLQFQWAKHVSPLKFITNSYGSTVTA